MPKLIKTMHLLNYSPDVGGVCFGISAMAAQAALRKGNEVFANRIKFIQNCTEAEIKTIKNSEKDNEKNFNKKLDLICFFDGVSIYQGAGGVNDDFKSIVPSSQNINDTIAIVKSNALENANKFAYPKVNMKLVNAYSREEFLDFIKEIKKFFGQQPFSILIHHFPINHATQIGFDAKNWLSTNHDSILFGEDNAEDLEKIVNNVFLSGSYDWTEHMVAIFDILLPEAVDIDLTPLKTCEFLSDDITGFSDKKILSHILACYLNIFRHDAYLDILQKIPSLTLTENEKIVLIESKQRDNTTALHIVAHDGELHVLHQLLKVIDCLGLSFETKIGIINKKNNYHISALYYAAQNGHTEVVKILLDLGTSIDDQSLKADFLNAGQSALLVAASKGYTAIVDELIKAILTIEDRVARNKCLLAKTQGGMSALSIAAQNGYTDIVRELIKAISSIENQNVKIEGLNAINNKGESALCIAQQRKHKNIIKLLRTAIKKEKRLLSEKNCLNLCVIS